jgi:GNAT superfamily N-acetyltransferase
MGYRYHVAVDEGVLAGAIAVRDNRHVYHLFVAESFQKRGLARQLWTIARDASLAAGNPGEFTVNSSRFAVSVYRRFGFAESGPPDERNGVVSVPMRLRLPLHDA